MKRFSVLLTALLMACSITGERGSLPLSLPSSLPSRASVNGDSGYTYARIYLHTEWGAVNIDPGTQEVYADVSSDSGTYIIKDIDPSFTYKVMILFGDKTESGVFHSIRAYAYSEDIQITAGIQNRVVLTIEPGHFTWKSVFAGKNIHQIMSVGPSLYTFTDAVSYQGVYLDESEIDTGLSEVLSLGRGMDLSGNDELWLNNSQGIFPWRSGEVDRGFSSALTTEESLNISDSGMIEFIPDTGEKVYLAFFQGEGVLGGVQIDTAVSPEQWEWKNRSDLIENVEGFDEILSDLDTVIYDYISQGNYAYLATAMPLPAFRVSGSVLDDYETLQLPEGQTIPGFSDLKTLLDFIPVRNAQGVQETVISLGLSGSYLYLGTKNGLYYTVVNETTGEMVAGSEVETLITGTEGKKIEKIQTFGTYGAAITENSLILVENGLLLKEYMNYEGLPGTLKDIAWQETTNGPVLVIAGSSGVTELDLTSP